MLGRAERHLGPLLGHVPEVRARALTETIAKVSAADLDDIVLPPEFTWRDYTIFLLTIAAQIEHSLMVQYLYAGYSLGGPQVPVARQGDVAAWRQLILGIAKEEMGHLITVQNTLRFLGAPLAIDRQDYPWDSQIAPYPFTLERLTRASLAKYVVVESPENWPADVTPQERAEIEKLASGYGGTHVNRVGKLYSALIKIINDATRLPTSVFHPETYPSQASWDEWGRAYGKGARGSSIAGTTTTPDVLIMRMTSRTDAVAALKAIAEQGEAPGTESASDPEKSHFRRFLDVYQKFPTDNSWDPARPIPDNPSAPGIPAGAGQTPISSYEGGLWANIFNLRYRMLLSYLAHTYQPQSGDDGGARRGLIINRMFGEMYNLRSIAAVLVHLPLANGSKQCCGPTFQMPYTLQLPQSDAGYWTLHLDLIDATASLLDAARAAGNPERSEYARALQDLDTSARKEMELYAAAGSVRTESNRLKVAVR
jgi:ferritin-like protein